MTKIDGSCSCKRVRFRLELPKALREYSPRVCDCDFCVKHGASYLSDTHGVLEFQLQSASDLQQYKQENTNGVAKMLTCVNCGVLVGVIHSENEKSWGAVNSLAIDGAVKFGPQTVVSPKKLSDEEKVNRFKQVWCSNVKMTSTSQINKNKVVAVNSSDIPLRKKPSNYPEPFLSRVAGREKRQLGDFFGLSQFGVNLTRLRPSSQSALFHYHTKQEEFIFLLKGEATLVTDQGETLLTPGMCRGFLPNSTAHQLVNKSDEDVLYLEIGHRISGDEVKYPNDDLKAELSSTGEWEFVHKDGRPY